MSTYHSLWKRAAWGSNMRCSAARAADHGAVPARRLHPLVARLRDAQPAVPRPAAVARQVRRPAARFPAITASVCNLRPARRGTIHRARADPAAARDRAELSGDRRGPPGRRRCAVKRRRMRPPRRWRAIARRSTGRERISSETRTLARPPARSAPRSSTRSARQRWGGGRSDGGARRAAEGARHRGPARHRRLRHAAITSGNTNSPTMMIAEKARR